MACLAENRNPPLDAEVESAITDAAASSLSAARAAAKVIQRINGATFDQVLAAAVRLIREQATLHHEIIDEQQADEDEISDLENEVADLRAKLKKTAGATP